MAPKLAILRPLTRTQASASGLRRRICSAGLTQQQAGRLVGVDARQVRRWLSGRVSLGPLELADAVEELLGERAGRRAA